MNNTALAIKTDHPPATNQDKSLDKPLLPNQKFPVDEALKLRLVNNLTFQQIGDKYGVSRQAIHGKLKKFMRIIGEPDLNKAFQERRVELLTGTERVLMEYLLDPKKLKDASLNNVAYAFKEINNARRLELGEATNIVQYDPSALRDRYNELKALMDRTIDVTPQASP